MRFAEYRYLVLSDLHRVTGSVRGVDLLKQVLFGESFKFVFWMRTCRYTRSRPALRYTLYPWARFVHGRLTYRLGISIPPSTAIGRGFYIGHFGGIVVNRRTVIGTNCTIAHGVTLGKANRGRRAGCPTIGNGVYLGPGSKVIGSIRIGDDVAIGANCVVTKDVPDHAVVVGIPGRVISHDGAAGYVTKTEYEDRLGPVGRVGAST